MTKVFTFILMLQVWLITNAQQQIIPLYKGAAPGSENWDWQEGNAMSDKPAPVKFPIAYNISRPSMTVFSPDSTKANGTAIIVCPGGGFHVLNIETEGSKVAAELNKRGITVFLLKYRLTHSSTREPWQEMIKAMQDPVSFQHKIEPVKKMALDDARIAIRYVREHATEYKINPKRIGILGFSAGGALAGNLAYNYTAETRPDFSAVLYAGIRPDIKPQVPGDAPPLFIAGASDDLALPVSFNIDLYNFWIAAKRSVELHLYAKGGHGLWGAPANTWIHRFSEWMEKLGFLE